MTGCHPRVLEFSGVELGQEIFYFQVVLMLLAQDSGERTWDFTLSQSQALLAWLAEWLEDSLPGAAGGVTSLLNDGAQDMLH